MRPRENKFLKTYDRYFCYEMYTIVSVFFCERTRNNQQYYVCFLGNYSLIERPERPALPGVFSRLGLPRNGGLWNQSEVSILVKLKLNVLRKILNLFLKTRCLKNYPNRLNVFKFDSKEEIIKRHVF